MNQKLIAVNEIPGLPLGAGGGNLAKYPYAAWAKIPKGQAVEVTELLDGVKPLCFVNNLRAHQRRNGGDLIAILRQERVWVTRRTKVRS